MKLLVLNGDLPIFPGRAGHEYLHTTGLARLARRVGLVSMVHTREMDEGREGLREAGVGLYLWRRADLHRAPSPGAAPRPSPFRRAGEAVYRALRNWRGHPRDTQVQDLQFRNIAGPLREALRDECWQAVIVVQSSSARWLDYFPRPPVSVLVLHDVRALVYERQARAAASLPARWAFRREARRYRRFEREYCRRYDLVITVSPADEAWVRAHYRPTRLATVPIPVDTTYFASMPRLGEAPARVTFTGMMAHPPNADAAAFFAREVLPRVQAAVPAAEFWIVGRDPPPEVRQLALVPGVVVTGFVQDMRPYIAQAAVVTVPLRFGSGMRNKILEAWAMEKCVVSTRVGAEGLACADGVNILLAGEDAPALAGRVIEALRDPGLRDRIRGGGRALVSTAHAPAALARRYYEVVASVVEEVCQRDDPLRAVIDLRWLRRGMGAEVPRLARSLVNHLLQLDGVNRYTLLVPAEAQYDFDGRGRANVRVAAVDGPGASAREAAHRAMRFAHRRLGHEYWRTPDVEALRRVRALDAEVALSMADHVHPDMASVPNVLLVPDLQHESHPEFFSPRDLDARRARYAASIRQASHICALSEFTRQMLLDRLAISPDRVTTVHPAADPMFHPRSRARQEGPRILRKHGLPQGEYVLLPGGASPATNHRAAYRALRVLRDVYGLEPLVVCTGTESGGGPAAALGDAGVAERVRFLGSCPATDLPGLYAGARALVFPSLFEGVGLPVLEAMWCDCPVVCSNVTSLPEVAGRAALLVDPHAPDELAHALHRVLTDEALRRVLIEGGRQRVRDFPGTRFALGVVSALHTARQLRYG